jgi:hypothetical protein
MPTMKRFTWLGLALFLGLATGCVERRMIVSAEPPGAAVFVNNVPYGTGPVDVPFIYYGTYHFTFIRDNYETLQVDQKVPAPWYQWLGIDFFTENLYPGKFRDIRCFTYAMQPLVAVPPADVLLRAKELKGRGELITPLSPDGKPLPPSDGLPFGSSGPAPPAPLPRNSPPPPSAVPGANILSPGPGTGSGSPNKPREE